MSTRPCVLCPKMDNKNSKKGLLKMASKIKAIGTYRPRIEQGNTVQKPELTLALAG